ncbi:hypothetical protein PLESTM_000659100 [Pleodorina starrii]|nr:hypothetical protein PLESTM_000659100 [Pleodorina starrii]
MPSQPPSRRQRPPSALSIALLGIALWLAISALYTQPLALAQADSGVPLTASAGPRLQVDDETTPLTFDVEDTAMLYGYVEMATANASDRVVLNLPLGYLVLNSTLKLPFSATLQGASASQNGPGTILSCGPGTPSLIEFSGSSLRLIGVQLQDCKGPGLLVTSGADASITMEDCLFRNFTRELNAGRVDVLNPGSPTAISDTSLALAVHAGNFSGNLTIRNTRFVDNHFSVLSARRRLNDESLGAMAGRGGHHPFGRQHRGAGGTSTDELTLRPQVRPWRTLAGMERADPWVNSMSGWGMGADSSGGRASGRPGRRLADDGSENRYSMPLLERAALIHPELQVGPWADDLEAVFSVVCQTRSKCAVTFEDSAFDNNTGVASGALYLLCDGADSCNVSLTNTTITNNRLLWQQATKQSLDDPPLPGDGEASLQPGVQLLMRMAAWLTYTYPLLDHYATHGSDGYYSSIQADSMNLYPHVVGRTLGAVVFHQRNSPWPGVAAGEDAMMRVNVNGGVLSGNDGAAIMSTAADFMQMAGGNGTWSGGPPRHSADFYLHDVYVADHASGWPAIWLRWARKVEISKLQVTRSTGAAWLEEVRDSAVVEDSVFEGNNLTDTWLDYMYYIPLKFDPFTGEADIGMEVSQVLKIQMTPLGDVRNFATIRGCRFEDNPSITNGVVYIVASDTLDVDVENLPGSTSVEVMSSTFANSFCGRPDSDGVCQTGERPLYMRCVFSASVQMSRFLENGNGGVGFTSVWKAAIVMSEFNGNTLTYSQYESVSHDSSYGGAAVFGESIGAGGVELLESNFTNNRATVGGGAVFLRYFATLSATSSRFENNTAATFDGGAIWLDVSHGQTETFIGSCNFTRNNAGRNGGAISAYDISQSGTQVGWYIMGCTFTDNAALLDPAQRGPTVTDQAGGGAIFAYAAALSCTGSNWFGNKVLAHAGGAIRVVESAAFMLTKCTFEDNVAIMGGAVALSRISGASTLTFNSFRNNTVVEPSWQRSASVNAPSLSYIDPGYGGALYISYSSVRLQTSGEFIGNTAKFGGAIAVLSAPFFSIQEESRGITWDSNILYVNVPGDMAQSAVGLDLPAAAGPALPYRYLLSNNAALIGGALYLYDTETIIFALTLKKMVTYPNKSFVESDESIRLRGQPAILFLNNTANGGGAAYLERNGQVSLANCRFAANNALVPPLAANFSGLYGLEKDYSTANALPCYHGGGGAICVAGEAKTTITVSSSDMINNRARDGAGVFIAEGLDCVDQPNCYNFVLSDVNMTGNAATSRGGGVFWMHEGILNIASCPSDKLQVLTTNGTALLDEEVAGSSPVGFTIDLNAPVRKGPVASWYRQLTLENQAALLSSVGGAQHPANSPVHAVNGEIVVAGNPVFARAVGTPGAVVQAPNGPAVAAAGSYLTAAGTVVLPDASSSSGGEPLAADWVAISGRPVVFSGGFLPDPSWLGVPYNHLPCANWNNSAETGPDVSTTPYFVLSPLRLDYYTSNTDIKINVTVHDWLGQLCTGGNETQPLVLVQAESTEVSGAVTAPAVNGTAAFAALRLRAREGLHSVTMTGRAHAPVRQLLSSQLRIYVRPCAINEFLSPKNLDECIPCDMRTYNLNMSAVACMTCPDNAECSYPDPSACKRDTGCDPTGYLVPEDGYWHANFFSEEVIECTNADACTTKDRSSLLSKMQFNIWQAARRIQLDAAAAVADKAAEEVLAKLLASWPPLMGRRLLQQKALTDDLDVVLILNATAAMLPEYLQSQCGPGYTGTLCGECAPGYGWRRIAACSKCPPFALNNLYYALVTILTLSLLAFTVYSSLKEQRRPGRLVGGITTTSTSNDPHSQAKPSKTAKVNPAGRGGDGHLGVQASGPSQFHVILAAAAVEDAAAEVAPALALLREHSLNPMVGDGGGAYEYVDPVLAAARNQYASAPGTPKGQRTASPAPYPVFETAARSHSVLGIPARASHWSTSPENPRRAAVSFSKVDRRSSGGGGGGGRIGVGGSHLVAGGGGGGGGGAGPVAEGVEAGYDNALYEGLEVTAPGISGGSAAAGARCTEIQPAEDEQVEVEQGYRKDEILAMVAAATVGMSCEGRRPVAESTDYTNALFEEPPRRVEIQQSTDGIAATDTPRGGAHFQQPTAITTASPSTPDNNEEARGGGSGGGAGGDPDAPEPSASRSRHIAAAGLMLQSVPVVLQSNSPPHTPLHASVTAVPPAALELPTVLERTRLNEIPRRGAVVGRERAHQSTVVKIFLSYVQVLALLQNVPLQIPGVLDVYYRINNQAISYPGILVSLDCSLPDTSVSKAFVRVILTVLAPLYIFTGSVLFFLVFNVIDYYILTPYYAKHPSKKNRKRHLQMPSFAVHLQVYLGRQLIVTFIAIFFFFYPSVVQSLMTIFNCQDVNVQPTNNPLANGLGLHTERIWSQDYGQACYKGSHLALVLGMGVPGVILIAIGWPLMSGLFMTGKLTCMNNISLTEDMTSFFLADFKARFAWWESVIMLRKLFIAVIVTLVDGSSSAGVQLLLVICILVIALGIHLAAMPYHHTYTNHLELMSLGTLLATLYFSLYFGFSTSISDGGRVAISILILVINIVMVLIFVYYIVQAYYYAALCKTGLSDIDSETRRKLTAAELRQRILEALNAQGSTSSFQADGQQQHPPTSQRPRSSYNHVASLYTAAVWASMRMGSTTNKVLTKMRTLLHDVDVDGLPSREGSVLGHDGVPAAAAAAPGAAGNPRNSHESDAILCTDEDPEAARGSAASRKRAVSGPGGAAAGATVPPRRISLTTSGPLMEDRDAAPPVRSSSRSSPGAAAAAAPASGSPGGSTAASPRDAPGNSGGMPGELAAAAAPTLVTAGSMPSPRTSPKVPSRRSSAASLDHSSPPPFPEVIGGPAAAAPPPPPPPAPATSSRPNVRVQSRLAQVSGQADRSGELLPPPPSFPGRSGSRPV